MSMVYVDFMRLAFQEAQKAMAADEVPVGAVVVSPEGLVVGAGYNQMYHGHDPSSHAEVVAIRAAAQLLGTSRLMGCGLYVTLEPCSMCAGLISLARLDHVIFGAFDSKGGGIFQGPRFFDHRTCMHRPLVFGGVQQDACGRILQDFFQKKRKLKK